MGGGVGTEEMSLLAVPMVLPGGLVINPPPNTCKEVVVVLVGGLLVADPLVDEPPGVSLVAS